MADLAALAHRECTAIRHQHAGCGLPVRHAPRPRRQRANRGEVRTGASPLVEESSSGSFSGFSGVGQGPSGAHAAIATAWGDAERLGRALPRGFARRNCRDLNSVQTDKPTTRFTRSGCVHGQTQVSVLRGTSAGSCRNLNDSSFYRRWLWRPAEVGLSLMV